MILATPGCDDVIEDVEVVLLKGICVMLFPVEPVGASIAILRSSFAEVPPTYISDKWSFPKDILVKLDNSFVFWIRDFVVPRRVDSRIADGERENIAFSFDMI